MPTNLIISPTFSDLHPAGSFKAVISGIEETEGQYGKQFRFHINTNITFQELGYALFYFTSQNFTANSKLGQLIYSVLGQKPEDYRGKELDLQELRDKLFVIKIEHQVRNHRQRAIVVDLWPYQEDATGTGGQQ